MSRVTEDTKPGPIGRNVKYFREWRGWSHADLAAEAGVDKSEIYQLERGVVQEVRATLLHTLAQALGVTVRDLMDPGERRFMPQPEKQDRERRNLMRVLRYRLNRRPVNELRRLVEEVGARFTTEVPSQPSADAADSDDGDAEE